MSVKVKTIVLPPRKPSELNKKPVTIKRAELEIDGPSLLVEENGRFVAVYLPNVFAKDDEAKRFYDLKYLASDRTSGIKSSSLIFGSAPRDPLKRLPARRCAFNKQNPMAFRELERMGHIAQGFFADYASDAWASHCSSMKSISEHWLTMPGLKFTSGIINNANQLIYHTDNGNMPGCFSMMYTFRRGISEGYLHLPEFNALIKNEHNSLLLFDGASVLHGVTPFKKLNSLARRITIVYYVLKKMASCAPNEKAEVEYQNAKRTAALWS